MIVPAHFEGIAAGGSRLFIANPRLRLTVIGQDEKDVVRDFPVDLAEHRLVKLRSIEQHFKDFDLFDGISRREI